MDMIKIFHGSLTIEDKQSPGNVRFSSSDTDISLSSSSILSSSSSMSLFSFDGSEATMPTSISSLSNTNDMQELSKLTTDVIQNQSENSHSVLKSHFVSENISNESVFSELNEISDKSINLIVDCLDNVPQESVLQISNDESLEDCFSTRSKVDQQTELDDSTFQMNLKNLTHHENIYEDVKKIEDGIICDQETIKAHDLSFLADEDIKMKESSDESVEAPNEQMELEMTETSSNTSHPNRKGHHVKFPNDEGLITGYVFPAIPWKDPKECSNEELISSYLECCSKYETEPSAVILSQLKEITNFNIRSEVFSLKGVTIDWKVCETLENIFKRVQFKTINLESAGLTEHTAMVMFDLLSYYEPCTRLILSSNGQMGIRGWQACGSYLRQSQTLKCFEARQSNIPEYSLSPLFRGIQMCANLTSLHLQGSVNPGRSLQLLASGLRGNRSIQDIHLGDNRFHPSDGLQLANLIKDNNNLQLIDLRNNNLQDTGAIYIFEAIAQSKHCNLNTLIVWNNKLTKGSMSMLSKMLKSTNSLETINLGHNNITDEGVYRLKEGLIKNNSLLRIGLQAIKVTCEGVVALAEFIVEHNKLQKLDLRGNRLRTAGLMALSQSLKVNRSVTCVAMDTGGEEEDAESVVKDENEHQEEIKRQYIQDILSYTIRNLDCKKNLNPDEATSSESTNNELISNQSKEISVTHPQMDEQFVAEDKRNFQARCQMLESPSVFRSDVSLFPSVERSNLISCKDELSASSSSLLSSSSTQSSSAAADSQSSASLSSSIIMENLLFGAKTQGDAKSSPTLQSSSSSSSTLQSSSSSLTLQSSSSSSQSSPMTVTAPSKPLVPKRKFMVSKAILPSLFSKSSQQQQPSVLYTASSESCFDKRGVTEGHVDAKVRIIGIQSEEKENATPMDSTEVVDLSLTPPPA